jgi:hypothetical protein
MRSGLVATLRYLRRLLGLGSALSLAQCRTPEPPIDVRLWDMVRCIECIDGEQAAVVAMGQSAVPGLRFFLLNGAPDSTIARERDALSGPFQVGAVITPPGRAGRGGRSSSTIGPPGTVVVPPAAVVAQRVDDFKAIYQMRSSLALGLIGTDSARRVLCEGKAAPLRVDVRKMIDSALVLLNGTCP